MPTVWLRSTYTILRRRRRDLASGQLRPQMHGRRFNDMRRSNVALRLQESLLEEVSKVAASEGVALNQFINVAVAEKLSALRTEDYFRERAERANLPKVKRILKRAGKGKAPLPGDQIA